MEYGFGRWLAATALLLGACAALDPAQTGQKMVGSAERVVRDYFGKPTETYQLANGNSRWIYSKQPLGYKVYAADFDGGGKLVDFRQMLTEKEVYEARPGIWTKRDMAEHFGQPREPAQHYPLLKREAWTYRMYAGNEPAILCAYFDNNGVLDRTMIIVDPVGGDSQNSSK